MDIRVVFGRELFPVASRPDLRTDRVGGLQGFGPFSVLGPSLCNETGGSPGQISP
jgi:hypothetical protein